MGLYVVNNATHLLKIEDVLELFHMLTEAEIHAATMAISAGEERDKLMGQGYILAIERARAIIRSIMKDVK